MKGLSVIKPDQLLVIWSHHSENQAWLESIEVQQHGQGDWQTLGCSGVGSGCIPAPSYHLSPGRGGALLASRCCGEGYCHLLPHLRSHVYLIKKKKIQ